MPFFFKSKPKKTELDRLQELIAHPSAENTKVTHIFLNDKDTINDITKNKGKKTLAVLSQLDKFPNLSKVCHPGVVLDQLSCGAISKNKKSLDEIYENQNLLTTLLCRAIQSSPTLDEIDLNCFLPSNCEQILTHINQHSSSIKCINVHLAGYDESAVNQLTSSLANFLSTNKTVTMIDLYYSPLRDLNALKIVHSIYNNRQSKINSLHMPGIPFTHDDTYTKIAALCKEKNISLTLTDGSGFRNDFSYIAFSSNLLDKHHRTTSEYNLVDCVKTFKSIPTHAVNLETLKQYAKLYSPYYPDDAAASLAFLLIENLDIRNEKSLNDMLGIIPENSKTLFLEQFVINHNLIRTGNISKWKHPNLEKTIQTISRDIKQELNIASTIKDIQNIIASYYSEIFPPLKEPETEATLDFGM